ncbi:MAG TPA: hypothetical protein V6D02_15935 [Candidatus Obscuribacterales bacterium]
MSTALGCRQGVGAIAPLPVQAILSGLPRAQPPPVPADCLQE